MFHIKLILTNGMRYRWYGLKFFLCVYVCMDSQLFHYSLLKTYCCSLSCLCIFVKNQLFMYVCVCVCVCLSSLAILFSLSIPFFMPVPHCIDYCGFLINFPKKAMAPHSSTLAWKIPWTEEPGRLQSMGSLRVGHD